MANILIVDDEPHVLEMLSMLLTKNRHQVMASGSVTEALDLIRAQQPDLIVSDIKMQPIDGWEFFKQARLQTGTNTIPFIFLSGIHATPVRVRALRMGADDFVSKPFQYAELLARIERCIERQRGRSERLPTEGITGKLGHLTLLDILQVMELNRRSALVKLTYEDDLAKIYILDGAIEGVSVNAAFDSGCFFKVLLWDAVTFSIVPYVAEVPSEHRNTMPTSELILEAARRHDELQRDPHE